MPYFPDTGDILLEINDQSVAGLTSSEIEAILAQTQTHRFKIVTGNHGLPLELREYLSRRFARGSADHQLQSTIRDHVYTLTVPITTRPPREGEVDGVDYKFVEREAFAEMDRCGQLLESGVYCNHYYGTPLPLNQPVQ